MPATYVDLITTKDRRLYYCKKEFRMMRSSWYGIVDRISVHRLSGDKNLNLNDVG